MKALQGTDTYMDLEYSVEETFHSKYPHIIEDYRFFDGGMVSQRSAGARCYTAGVEAGDPDGEDDCWLRLHIEMQRERCFR